MLEPERAKRLEVLKALLTDRYPMPEDFPWDFYMSCLELDNEQLDDLIEPIRGGVALEWAWSFAVRSA